MAKNREIGRRVRIVGTGAAIPERVLTNHELEKMVDTSDEWIRERTGILRRHVVDDDTAASDLAKQAALEAMETAGAPPEDIDMVIVGTSSPDMFFPSTACLVQDHLGAKNAGAFDLSAGCTGFLYGLGLGNALISANQCDTVLVIGTEALTKFIDWTDRNTCVLFGDGAGAVILQPSDDDRGIISVYLNSDGSLGHLLQLPAGGSRRPATVATVEERLHYVKMVGSELFKSAIKNMGDAAVCILEQAGLTADDIDLLIPHQANIRIIKATAKRIDLPMDKLFVNVHEHGNTSAASIPIALDEAIKNGALKEGDLCLMVAFGAGFTWGSAMVRI